LLLYNNSNKPQQPEDEKKINGNPIATADDVPHDVTTKTVRCRHVNVLLGYAPQKAATILTSMCRN